eukprot:scpid91357/ scgid24733/ 
MMCKKLFENNNRNTSRTVAALAAGETTSYMHVLITNSKARGRSCELESTQLQQLCNYFRAGRCDHDCTGASTMPPVGQKASVPDVNWWQLHKGRTHALLEQTMAAAQTQCGLQASMLEGQPDSSTILDDDECHR